MTANVRMTSMLVFNLKIDNMIAEKEKVFLFCDENTYLTYKKSEDEMFKALDHIKRLYVQCIVSGPEDYKTLLENVPNTFVHDYWRFFCMSYMPEHLDKENIFEQQTKITVLALEQLQSQFWMYHKKLGEHRPKITAKGVTSNLKKDSFNKYLDPEKADHYNVLKRLLEVAQDMEKYSSNIFTDRHTLRKYSDGILMNDNSELVINYYKFL